MSKAADGEILRFSVGKSAIVVTLDADFHAILAVSGASDPPAIRVRLQGLDTPEVVELVQRVVARFEPDLARGLSST